MKYVLFSLIALFTGCTIVQPGYVGMKKSAGKLAPDGLEPGFYWLNPLWDSVDHLDTRLVSFVLKTEASSKDLQVVTTEFSVQHSMNGKIAPRAYAVIGGLDKFDQNVVTPAAKEAFKAVAAKYSAEELITKREMVKQQAVSAIQAFIDQTLNDKGVPGALHISNVAITDFDFSPAYTASIEAKVVAQQKALQAENDKQKRITEAEASAREKELQAEAEAYQIEKVSIQRAAALEREAKALAANEKLLELRAIEKWTGNVPTYSGGGQAVPFINIGK